ncbi:MAG: ClbS/DfsB family four-helix bundle protein [Candidatus Eisenbacteria bacterium]|nr:ClbS/DfsB family four-helix bundle protein [Candidatus Latescibacterota bacterium]MBD3303487.1 ClbS/DfsB family four-helix bundle protein [Candidatus Eisenbacteria bacterium]
MPIPRTRRELIDQIDGSFDKLAADLASIGRDDAERPCVEDWSVKELLAVRAWWTESVVGWIEAGRRGEVPDLPAPGYGWNETPRLNADLARAARKEPYEVVRSRLEHGFRRVRTVIDALDDRELLEVGAFDWAGKWPIARWISINTARQYQTARTMIRRALRERR